MKKKLLIILGMVMLLIPLINIKTTVKAEPQTGVSGTCTWNIDDNGNMVIKPTSGSECTLANSTALNSMSYNAYRDQVKTIKFEGKVKTNARADHIFEKMVNLTNINLTNFDTSNATTMVAMFNGNTSLTGLDLNNFNTSNVTNMESMFAASNKLQNINLSSFDTSNVKNMKWMFSNCNSLTNLDLSSFDTSNVTTMYLMFKGCSSLTSLDVSNFDTSNVTNMQSMFNGCSSLTSLDISNFDTSSVTTMNSMFRGCSSLTSLDLSNFDTSNVTNMQSMFNGCSKLTSLDLSNFNTSSVTNMNSMFNGCSSLTSLDISNFDTTNVTNPMGFNNTPLTKIVLGNKTKLEYTFGRGMWKKEEDGKLYPGVEISAGINPGTYTKVSNISTEMKIPFKADYKIENITKIDEFTTTNPEVFKKVDDQGVVVYFPLTTTEEVTLSGKAEMIFKNVVTDKDNNKYDLKMTMENIKFYDLAAIDGVDNIYAKIMELVNQNSIVLSGGYYKTIDDVENDFKVYIDEKRDSKSYDVTFNILKKNGTPVEGNYIFSAYDLDGDSYRDREDPSSTDKGYGNYSEGINLNEGFDINNVILSQYTALQKIGNNRYTGTTIDNSTERSEFIVKGDASESKLRWTTGYDMSTMLMSYYQPRNVEITKEDENGNKIAGAHLAIYQDDTLVEEVTTEDHPVKVWLNPGMYTLKEIQAPNGYIKSDEEIVFFADTEDRLTIDGEEVNGIVVKNERKSYQVTTYYYKQGTTEPLGESITQTKKYQDPYQTNPLTNIPEGYELVGTPSNASGTVEGDTVVIYEYKLKDVELTIKHVDENGNEIIPSTKEMKKYGSSYTTTPMDNDEYELITTPTNANGTIKESTTVTYVYKKKEVVPEVGTITVKYVDTEGNEVASPEVTTKEVGNSYTSSAKEVEGYVLKTKPSTEEYTYTSEPQEVVYVYEKVKVKVSTKVRNSIGGNIEGDEEVLYGNNSTAGKIRIRANQGYVISKVWINGSEIEVPKESELLDISNFLKMSEDKLVEVEFKEKAPTVIVPPTSANTVYTIIGMLGLIAIGVFGIYYNKRLN